MKQRDIYLINLNPVKGSEQAGVRPAVIVSGDIMNKNFNMSIVCPISSKVKGFSSSVLLTASKRTGLKDDSEVLPFQLRTVSHKRFIKKIGTISGKELRKIFKTFVDIFSY